MLDQGIRQYKALDFTGAKASLLQADPAKLSADDASRRKGYLDKVDAAILRQRAGRQGLDSARSAVEAGDLAKAAALLKKVVTNEFLPKAELDAAHALAADVDATLNAAS